MFSTICAIYTGHDFALNQEFFFPAEIFLPWQLFIKLSAYQSPHEIQFMFHRDCEQILRHYIHFYFRKDILRLR